MSKVRILPKTLKKSDGNFIYWDGKQRAQRHPPEEVKNTDPNGIDHAPPFAHTGSHAEDETGEFGVGKVIPGKYEAAPHGGLVYKDELGGLHFHGIDGVIHSLGNLLKSEGIDDNAAQLVQQAIEETNNDPLHRDNPENHLPDLSDKAWRRLVMSDYQGPKLEEQGRARQHYVTIDGQKQLITGYRNFHGQKSPHGMFLDSLANPVQPALARILKEKHNLDASQGRNDFLSRPHIRSAYLSYALSPNSTPENPQYYRPNTSARTGQVYGNNRQLRGAFKNDMLSRLSDAGIDTDVAFPDTSAYGIAHMLPDRFFRRVRKGTRKYIEGGEPTGAVRVANQEIMDAIGHSSVGGEAIVRGRVKQTLNPLEHPALANTMYQGRPLSQILATDGQRQEFLTRLLGYDAFMKIFGKTSPNSPAGRLASAFTELHTGLQDTAELPAGTLDLGGIQNHVSAVRGIYKTGRHLRAKDMRALAIHSGHEEAMGNNAGNFKLRTTELTPELEAKYNIKHQEPYEGEVEEIRGVMEAISEFLADAKGHETRLTHPIELPTQPAVNTSFQLPNNQGMNLADHVRYSPLVENTMAEGTTRAMGGSIENLPSAPVVPQVTQMATPPSNVARTQPPTSVNLAGAMSPEQITAARTGAAALSDDQMRELMRVGGARSGGSNTPIAQPQVDRFRSAFTDPNQRMITEYMKSQNSVKEAQDRLIKTMERLQIKDAKNDSTIIKHLSENKLSIDSPHDVSTIAKKLGLAPQDIRLINESKGDWMRLNKSFGFSERDIKIVKLSFRGD
tara:strand:- start:104 stop:2467 length:2364 start_codon:yes stop_codon:yes gene_type:complete